ncbi:hypothetical protein CC85DRAFT_301023 [Cutaneotrichosporon oleaginosum]|uniref:Ricin B lectin domain-containing protein n=1 Tax=Cutaneotrichosporon oleaginosum TaxID=879819 RepID=A0A0J0XRX2_9TREE|nr:uncharacterized protein CC85DRAFT_301023 [Cutaneotrichosporon oleaginosum]KLT43853.1 hypothetical protein CC85DRAFT_301023 [Cutaneotrichosporon oleaginosum]TXT06407.1 hypothetical protein COLE_05738 [Cutaneotrichosporon oleaginosum]
MVAVTALLAILATVSAAHGLSRRQDIPAPTSPQVSGKLRSMLGGCLAPANGTLVRQPCKTAPKATFNDDSGELKFGDLRATVRIVGVGIPVTLSLLEAEPFERYDGFGGGGVAPNPYYAHTIRAKDSSLCLDARDTEVVLHECQRYSEAQMVRFR